MIIELFCKLALVIPAVPDKLELVKPEIVPVIAIVPDVLIVPPDKLRPDTGVVLATICVTVPVLFVKGRFEIRPLFTLLSVASW